jgi:hypothetical protein
MRLLHHRCALFRLDETACGSIQPQIALVILSFPALAQVDHIDAKFLADSRRGPARRE